VLDENDVERCGAGLEVGVLERVGKRHALERRRLAIDGDAEPIDVAGIRDTECGDAWRERTRHSGGRRRSRRNRRNRRNRRGRHRRSLPDGILDGHGKTRQERSALAHALVSPGLAIELERLLGCRDDRKSSAMLARIANQRERFLAGHAPANHQRVVQMTAGQMGPHAGEIDREIEFEMRMGVGECAADDARFARVASDVQHLRGSAKRRLVAGLRRAGRRRIAIRGHALSEVAQRPLFQELLKHHIWRNVSA
jgi:hypothetical protein